MQRFIERVVAGRHLSEEESYEALLEVMSGEATPAQIGAFITALRMKGETVDEVVGAARAMRRLATPVRPKAPELLDTCGTGGDGRHTFNISTTVAFVAAAAGIAVAKHGNRSVSSRSGSADVLEALGVPVDLGPEGVARCIDEVGFGFLFAPRYHGAMKHAIGPRREIGVRTIFNILGPLTNPAGARYQLLGVYEEQLVELVAGVLAALGVGRAMVVHGAGGLDELSLAGENRIALVEAGRVTLGSVDPKDYGLPRVPVEDLVGGNAHDNAAITLRVLAGEPGPHRDVVLLNAAAAIYTAGGAGDLREGLEIARQAIDSGRALERLDSVRNLACSLAQAS